MNRIGTLSICVACALAAPAQPAAGGALTFRQVVDVALSDSPELAMSKLAISAAREHLDSTRTLYYPHLSLEANALMWGHEIAFDLPVPCADDPMTPVNECPMGVSLQTLTVRDRFTASASVTASQAITPMWPYRELVKIDEAGVGKARAEHETARLEVAYRAAEGYLRMLQARAGFEIAQTGVSQLTAHLERARILKEGGVLETVDIMRIEAALASARQKSIAVERTIGLARDGLILVLGLPVGADVDVVDDLPIAPPAPPLLGDEELDGAAAARPEVAVARAQSTQANAAAEIAWMKRVPRVYAVATYQRNEGGGTFQANDDWFLGLTMQWDAWDWGQQSKLQAAAELDAKRAKLATERYQDRVRLEVKRAAIEARSAHEALAVAITGSGVAEEAFRIQRERFNEGALSATDLLDAETEVARSRLGYANARYEYYIALVALARATGQLPDAVLGAGGKVK